MSTELDQQLVELCGSTGRSGFIELRRLRGGIGGDTEKPVTGTGQQTVMREKQRDMRQKTDSKIESQHIKTRKIRADINPPILTTKSGYKARIWNILKSCKMIDWNTDLSRFCVSVTLSELNKNIPETRVTISPYIGIAMRVFRSAFH
jgi:hypothetical protein